MEVRAVETILSALPPGLNTELAVLSIRPSGKEVTPAVILDRGYTVQKSQR